MKCEIEFLAVGEASKAGDAIVIRYGEPTRYNVMVVDCGMAKTGIDMAKHLQKYFPAPVRINDFVLTHPDKDHACGLRELLPRIPADRQWLIPPWLFAEVSRPYFADKTISGESLKKKIREEYDIVDDIISIAAAQNTEVKLPLQGESIGPFRVLSPSFEVYRALMPQFDRTPEADKEALEAIGMWLGSRPSALQQLLTAMIEKASEVVQNLVPETWNSERLKDGGVTSASNESSVVLYGVFDDGPVLLTGDAGVNALSWAADYAASLGISFQEIKFIQVPHHGSRRNVGPTVLNRILGPIVPQFTTTGAVAFVSAPADDSTHPRKIVTNAFIRRGAKVIATQGQNKIHYGGFPARPDYSNAIPLDFSSLVEDYD